MDVRFHVEQELVGVSGEGRQTGERVVDIACRRAGRSEQGVELVVFHVDRQLAAIHVDEFGNRTHCLFGEAGNGQAVHVQPVLHTHPEEGGQVDKGQSIGVLKEEHVSHAGCTPLGGCT